MPKNPLLKRGGVSGSGVFGGVCGLGVWVCGFGNPGFGDSGFGGTSCESVRIRCASFGSVCASCAVRCDVVFRGVVW